MVVLAPRFAFLAAIATISTFPGLPEVEGAVIHGRQQADGYRSYRNYGHSRRFNHPSTRTVFRRQETAAAVPPKAASAPTLPLPVSQSKVKSEGAGGSSSNKHKRGSFTELETDVYLEGVLKRSEKTEQSVATAEQKHADKEQQKESGHGLIEGSLVGGSLIYRREPHKHDHEEKIFVTGDYDTVKFSDSQTRDLKGLERKRTVSHTDRIGVDLPKRKVTLNDAVALFKRNETEGVAGHIDIMSPVANSTVSQRIASLLMKPNGPNGTYEAGSPLVLNASGADFTSLYMVSLPHIGPDSNSSTPTGSTTHSNATLSGSVSGDFVKVLLRIPLFEPETASSKDYCVTFDPKPVAPGPLTVEDCIDPTSTLEHKSQLFAYRPDSGAVQPMWFSSEDDGTGSQTQAINQTDDDESSNFDGDGNDSTSAAPQDPTTPGSSSIASVTSVQALDAQFGDATRSPSYAHSFAQADGLSTPSDSSTVNARNVTMVFVPAEAELVSSERAKALKMDSLDPTTTASTDPTSVASTASVTGSATTLYSSRTASAVAGAYDFSSSYSASVATTATATDYYPAATSTSVTDAGYSDNSNYYSTYNGTPTSSSVIPTATGVNGLSAPDADFDNSTSAYPSDSTNSSSMSASGFGFDESTSIADFVSTSASASATTTVAGTYDYTSATPLPSASTSGISAAAYDVSSSTLPTVSESATIVSSTGSASAAAFDASSFSFPTSSATALSAASLDETSAALPTSTYGSQDVATTLSSPASTTGASAEAVTPTTSSDFTTFTSYSTVSPVATAGALGVEVYDLNAPAQAPPPNPSVGAQAVESAVTSSASAPTPTMTPVSTEPYEWMFKKGTVRSREFKAWDFA